MRQGVKEEQLFQTMVVGMTADLHDTIQAVDSTDRIEAGIILPREGRRIIRGIGR